MGQRTSNTLEGAIRSLTFSECLTEDQSRDYTRRITWSSWHRSRVEDDLAARFGLRSDGCKYTFEVRRVDFPEPGVHRRMIVGDLEGESVFACDCPRCGAAIEEVCVSRKADDVSYPWVHEARLTRMIDMVCNGKVGAFVTIPKGYTARGSIRADGNPSRFTHLVADSEFWPYSSAVCGRDPGVTHGWTSVEYHVTCPVCVRRALYILEREGSPEKSRRRYIASRPIVKGVKA